LQAARRYFDSTVNISTDKISVSAPGRICLFGEHQDYLGLPVIPAAITLRITVSGTPNDRGVFRIELPDISDRDEFPIDIDAQYLLERDYLRSVFNILRWEGVRFERGYDCIIRGDLPINSGTSSSSALCVAWVKFLLTAGGDARKDDPSEIARLAHRAEVVEFNEPGGAMDHFASAYGSVIYVDIEPEFRAGRLDARFGDFVLGDSLQEKDTRRTLARIKREVLGVAGRIRETLPDYTLGTADIALVKSMASIYAEDEWRTFTGTLMTRDITRRARELLVSGGMDDRIFGDMLNEQQEVLREMVRISTPMLESMIHASLDAGAPGAEISGSGEGGCMFAYAPGRAEAVAEAIRGVGGKAYIIGIGEGVREDFD
jgi:galactokinase